MCNSIIDANVATTTTIEPWKNIQCTELAELTACIYAYGLNMRESAKQIAVRVAYIRENADALCVEFEGKTSGERFTDYGAKILGIKRAQLNAFAKVGKELLDENAVSILPVAEGKGDYTMTQLQALLPLPVDVAKRLSYDEVITPAMKVSEIKQVVAENRPDAAEKAAKAKKREQEKTRKEQQQRAAEQAINGVEVANITINEKPDGSYIVKLNGNDITTSNVGKYLIRYIVKK